jgi:very-short-patch-repair endonuclease
MNAQVWVGPGHAVEVDALWPEVGLAVEVDGGAIHGGVLAREDDDRKLELLTATGLRVSRVGEWRLRFARAEVVVNLRRAHRPSIGGSPPDTAVDPPFDGRA